MIIDLEKLSRKELLKMIEINPTFVTVMKNRTPELLGKSFKYCGTRDEVRMILDTLDKEDFNLELFDYMTPIGDVTLSILATYIEGKYPDKLKDLLNYPFMMDQNNVLLEKRGLDTKKKENLIDFAKSLKQKYTLAELLSFNSGDNFNIIMQCAISLYGKLDIKIQILNDDLNFIKLLKSTIMVYSVCEVYQRDDLLDFGVKYYKELISTNTHEHLTYLNLNMGILSKKYDDPSLIDFFKNLTFQLSNNLKLNPKDSKYVDELCLYLFNKNMINYDVLRKLADSNQQTWRKLDKNKFIQKAMISESHIISNMLKGNVRKGANSLFDVNDNELSLSTFKSICNRYDHFYDWIIANPKFIAKFNGLQNLINSINILGINQNRTEFYKYIDKIETMDFSLHDMEINNA